MRIAITGAHGVGKTTLAKRLVEALDFNLIPDAASEAYHKGFPVNEHTTPETQFWILSKQLEYEKEAQEKFIADKCLLDNIVYSKFTFNDPLILKVIKKLVLNNLNYDLFLYIPIEIPLIADGRSIDPQFQKLIDQEYLRLFKKLNLKFYRVQGTVEDRVQQSLQIIKNLT